MSREYYAQIETIHAGIAERFSRNADSSKRHVECRIDDQIYVYLMDGDAHVQTQHVEIPEAWIDGKWPKDETVRRYIHRWANIGSVRITSLTA